MDTPTLPPPSMPPPLESNDKLLAILCHVSFLLGVGFILPLIVYLVKRRESVFVEYHSRQVLNFHLSLLLYIICSIPLFFILIGFPIFLALVLMGFICAIIGAVKASEGGFYCYPLTIPFIS